MKKLLLLGAVIGAVAGTALANLPTYKTVSATGNSSVGAQVLFPADANSQIRVVDVAYSWDTTTAAGLLQFSTGSTAYYQTFTNAATTSQTNFINSTNGLAPNGLLILQQGGICYTSTVLAFAFSGTNTVNNLTNTANNLYGPNGVLATNLSYVVLTNGGWGVSANVGSDIYLMGQSTVSRYVSASTNAFDGDAIYVGNYGRPVMITLPVATTINRLAGTAHYDSQTQ
jgi:hypothetical protein